MISSINQKLKSIQNILLVFICLLLFILLFIAVLSFLKLNENFNSSRIENKEIIGIKTAESTPIPTPTLIPKPTMRIIAPGFTRVSQTIDLTNWKLTLPTGDFEKPMEIKQPTLNTFEADPWFISVSSPSGVLFRAPVNGVTTGESDYPRSELREMTSNGTQKASWESTSGTHTMYIDQAITAVPNKKKHVVAGQIHDKNDDIIVIRLEENNLYINVDGKNKHTLDSNYTLRKRFSVKFVVRDGKTEVYYNGETAPSYTLNKNYNEAYFKAGAYTQSNCSKEKSEDCSDSNFGEVIIYDLFTIHR